MSLRTFHLVFILLVIVGADLFGAWAVYHHPTAMPEFWMGIAALAGGLGLCWYAYRFTRRMEAAGIAG